MNEMTGKGEGRGVAGPREGATAVIATCKGRMSATTMQRQARSQVTPGRPTPTPKPDTRPNYSK